MKKERLERKGLYNPENEHDACGVGMVVNIHGNKSHELVDNALKVLENMRHRGAEGADGKTGDGAGIMLLFSCKESQCPRRVTMAPDLYSCPRTKSASRKSYPSS